MSTPERPDLPKVDPAIQALDPQATDQAAGRVVAAVEAIKTFPDIHSRCA